jgi:hypothetical protein
MGQGKTPERAIVIAGSVPVKQVDTGQRMPRRADDHEIMPARYRHKTRCGREPRPRERPAPSDARENIMINGEGRIVAALGAVFVTLGGIHASLRGLLFDETAVMYYGVLAILVGAASFVVMLTPFPSDEP